MNITKKPVRKCNGCALNLRSECGVFEIPRLMWDRGRCPGYGNEELAMKYKASRAMVMQAKQEARRKRQQVQALRKTESHRSGQMYTVVTADNPADKKRTAAMHANYVIVRGTRKPLRAPLPSAARRSKPGRGVKR